MESEVMTPKEAAEFLKIPLSGVWRRVRRNELPAVRVGRCVRFSRSVLIDWLRRQSTAAEQK